MPGTVHDVLVVGGGVAGLSAAIALGRSLRSVVLVDDGRPRNAPSPGAHNLLGHDGIAPVDLVAAGRREAGSYGVDVLDDRVVTARRVGDVFEARLIGRSDTVQARRVVLATGLVDELPDIPGVRGHWGRSVLHCPYCHGYEVRGQRIAVVATSPNAVHLTLLFRQLSDRVTLILHDAAAPQEEAAAQLEALGVCVVGTAVERLRTDGGVLRSVVLVDGGEIDVDAVVVTPRFVARGGLYEQLGGVLAAHPMGGSYVAPTSPLCTTGVEGVYVAGNTGDISASLAPAAAAGLMAGAAVNADLVADDARRAVREKAAAA